MSYGLFCVNPCDDDGVDGGNTNSNESDFGLRWLRWRVGWLWFRAVVACVVVTCGSAIW